MSYTKRGNTVMMRCNAGNCSQKLVTELEPHETSLDGYRRLNAMAKGWTSSSTHHYCPEHPE